MAQESLPNGPRRRSDPPSQVRVTVTVVAPDRARRLRETRTRLARAPRSLLVGVAVAAVAVAAAVAVVLEAGRTGGATGRVASTQRAGTSAVAAAFGYPQRCLSIAISAADPDYASAHVDHRGACAHYRGYVNASFHRVGGVWRLILDEGQLFVPNRLLAPTQAVLAGAGAASGLFPGCVSVGVALHDPRFGRPGFDRRIGCVGRPFLRRRR
jgi:hypothetical protein